MTQYLRPPPGNPIVQLLAAIGAVVGLVISFILGFFAVAIIAGVVLLGMLVVGIRVAWLRRRWRRHLQETGATEETQSSSTTLDAEYEVISRRRGEDL